MTGSPTGTTLFCLPFAGAHADPFRAVAKARTEAGHGPAVTLTYPGHGARMAAPVETSVVGMARDALAGIRERLEPGEPVALLGYSMGSLVAYELSFLLAEAGHRVSHLLVMASTPPNILTSPVLSIDSDDELIAHCEQYGLIDTAVFASPELRRTFAPSLRSDILAVSRYAQEQEAARRLAPLRRIPAETALAVFCGDADRTVDRPLAWGELHDGDPAVHRYAGGHFFINDHPERVITDVLDVLARPAAPAAGACDLQEA